MVDLNVVVRKATIKEEVNAILTEKAQGALKGVLEIDVEQRVSQDFVTTSWSSIVATDLTQVICGDMIKIMAWYDNEWGYSTRLIDMAVHVSK